MAATKIYDMYAAILNFKKAVSPVNIPFVSTSWVPPFHRRRIEAYSILKAYDDCYSRDFRYSPESGDAGTNDKIREYGTPGWLCDKLTIKLLGGDVSINIPMPKSIGTEQGLTAIIEDEDIEESQKNTARQQLEKIKSIKAVIAMREAFLVDWFESEEIYTKIHENERTAAILGDMVYVVSWDDVKKTVVLNSYDPAFCFPDLDCDEVSLEDDSTEVKDRVSIAWQELDDPQSDTGELRVYRRVYELRSGSGNTKKCFMHEAVYVLPMDTNKQLWDFTDEDLADSGSDTKWVDMGIDFIPVVWIPNIQVQGEAFGRSHIHKLLPLFDSIQNCDTDITANSEHLGGATVIFTGPNAKGKKDSTTGLPIQINIRPGCGYLLGEGGGADLLDTSTMQDALLKTRDKLDDALIQLSDLTTVGAGRIKAGEVPSGVALAILLLPLTEKMGTIRQQRRGYYKRLFDYVQKLFLTFGTPEQKAIFAGTQYSAVLNYGSIVPGDEKSDIERYSLLKDLLGVRATLERMKEEGWDIDVDTIMERLAEEAEARAQGQLDMIAGQRMFDTGAGNSDRKDGQDDNGDGGDGSGNEGSNGSVKSADGSVDAGVATQVTLNGAQITAAVDVVQQVTAKGLPAIAGIELLVAVGIQRENADMIVNAATKMKKVASAAAPTAANAGGSDGQA